MVTQLKNPLAALENYFELIKVSDYDRKARHTENLLMEKAIK